MRGSRPSHVNTCLHAGERRAVTRGDVQDGASTAVPTTAGTPSSAPSCLATEPTRGLEPLTPCLQGSYARSVLWPLTWAFATPGHRQAEVMRSTCDWLPGRTVDDPPAPLQHDVQAPVAAALSRARVGALVRFGAGHRGQLGLIRRLGIVAADSRTRSATTTSLIAIHAPKARAQPTRPQPANRCFEAK